MTWDYITDLITNPEEFENKLWQAQAREATTLQPKQQELEHVVALLEETEAEAYEIARATPKAKGIIAVKLEQQAAEVDSRYQALMSGKAELEESFSLELTDESISNLLQFRNAVAMGLQGATADDKRQWLEILKAKVTVTNGVAVISCRLGSDPTSCNLFEINNC